jgi:hypothetical protein
VVHDTAEALTRGKAAVAVITEQFENLAGLLAGRVGWPGMRMHILPYPLVTRDSDELKRIAHEHFRGLLRSCGLPN